MSKTGTLYLVKDFSMSGLSLTEFVFNAIPVRVVQVGGEPWFVGKDVAEVLGYSNASDALTKHCKGVVKRYPLQTAGGMQEMRIINEPDMLRLIVSSKLPSAEKFERWVFEEVLPSIRKTGAYSVAQAASLPAIKDPNLAAIMQTLVELDAVKQAQAVQGAKLVELEAKLTTSPQDYYTIAGYASLRGMKIDTSKANLLGRKASKLSREYGVEIGTVHNAQYGTVHSYHLDVLAVAFEEF